MRAHNSGGAARTYVSQATPLQVGGVAGVKQPVAAEVGRRRRAGLVCPREPRQRLRQLSARCTLSGANRQPRGAARRGVNARQLTFVHHVGPLASRHALQFIGPASAGHELFAALAPHSRAASASASANSPTPARPVIGSSFLID
jgi:hypothetical protein